jgi:hypothetical protein
MAAELTAVSAVDRHWMWHGFQPFYETVKWLPLAVLGAAPQGIVGWHSATWHAAFAVSGFG